MGRRPNPGPAKSGAPNHADVQPLSSLHPTITGSASLDIPFQDNIAVTPALCPFKLQTGIKGQIPPGTVGVLSKKKQLNHQGISVHVGIVDSDYR